MPFIWIIGYFLGGVTLSGTGVLRYSNSQTVISVFIFLLLIAGIFYIFSKITSNSNNNDSKNKYLSKSNSNINVNTEKQINKKNITVSKMSNKVMEINAEEEEEIYAKVSKEFSSEDKKEGAWTKALILSEGDENKAKIEYMKLRVEILKNELIEKKIQNKLENEEKTKQNFLDIENKFKAQLELLNKRREFDTNEEIIPFFRKSNLAGNFQIEVNFKSGFFFIPETYIFSIFLDLKKDSSPYYWINELGEKKYFETLDLAKDNIKICYEEFISNIKLLKEHKNR